MKRPNPELLAIALCFAALPASAQGNGTQPWWTFSQGNATNQTWCNPYDIRSPNGTGFFDMNGNQQRYWAQRGLGPISGTGHELWDSSTGRLWVGDVPT